MKDRNESFLNVNNKKENEVKEEVDIKEQKMPLSDLLEALNLGDEQEKIFLEEADYAYYTSETRKTPNEFLEALTNYLAKTEISMKDFHKLKLSFLINITNIHEEKQKMQENLSKKRIQIEGALDFLKCFYSEQEKNQFLEKNNLQSESEMIASNFLEILKKYFQETRGYSTVGFSQIEKDLVDYIKKNF